MERGVGLCSYRYALSGDRSDGVLKHDGIPAYADLPVDASRPPSSSWGVFGDDDQVGTINLLTADGVVRAAQLVRKGAVFSLNWDLDRPDPPISGRGSIEHTILRGPSGTDDYYDSFYPQRSSQWDALSHIRHPEFGFYNGCTTDEITGRPGSRNGIDNWATRGIVGRFVLADLARYRAASGNPLDPGDSDPVTIDEIEGALAWGGVQLEGADVLLLRFGWTEWYERLDEASRVALAAPPHRFKAAGVSPSERTAEWLWDNRVAAVAADCPALEAHPVDFDRIDGCLHYRLIPLLGMALGEMFLLDDLAADCAADTVYEGLFSAAPLNKVGGSGSPANALAIK